MLQNSLTSWDFSNSQLDMMNSGNFRAMHILRACSFPHLLHDEEWRKKKKLKKGF